MKFSVQPLLLFKLLDDGVFINIHFGADLHVVNV